MRADSAVFATANAAVTRQPRYVVQIIFTSSSPSLTNRTGIANVPGTLIDGVIKSISSISQQVWPEEGRATIGSVTVELVETSAQAFRDELYDQLTNSNEGIRDREIRIYTGFSDDFDDFVRVATAYVDGVEYHAGVWRISARDKSRELRKQILATKTTRLSAALTDTDTTITAEDTSDFETITHGTSFTDAPSATVGYARIEETGEIFRYTGKTSTTFTGVTRGVFNTKAQAVEFDPTQPRDSWPEIVEYIYLELPGPLMALTLMTGDMNPTGAPNTVPDHWHMGLSWPDDFDAGVWQNIGRDLWDPNDPSEGFPIRFAGIEETEGKSFLEKEVYQLLGVYSPITLDGRISVRRVNRVIGENGWVRRLGTDRIVKHGELKYDQNAVVNQFRVDYNWNGDDLTRSILITDAASIARHGTSDPKILKFKGLHTARHTERAIRERLAVLRDRYGEPPLRLKLTAVPPMNGLEIGDVIRVVLSSLLDYTTGLTVNRTFEIQRTQLDWMTGRVDLDLISSARLIPSQTDNDGTGAALPDAFYTSAGTNITGLAGYSAGHLTANVTITGSTTDLASSVFYHDGDLTIDAGVTLTIQNQAQLRVKGFLQVNGDIDGAGNGYAGATDSDTVGNTSTAWTRQGTSGFLGPTIPGDGMWVYLYDVHDIDLMANVDGAITESLSKQTVAPRLALEVSGNTLSGIPKILQGTSGGSGGQLIYSHPNSSPVGSGGTVRAKGGSGGASGAGLMIICRGLGFGVSGHIDLSGADGSAGQKGTTSGAGVTVWDALSIKGKVLPDWVFQAGPGAGGFPGAFYVLLDGDGVPYPDLNSSTLICNRGATPLQGTPPQDLAGDWHGSSRVKYPIPRYPAEGRGIDISPLIYLTGYSTDIQAAAVNIWPVAHSVQYIPDTGEPVEDAVPIPMGLVAEGGVGIVSLSWTRPGAPAVTVEVFASSTNDRAFAEEVGQVSATQFVHHLPEGGQRWYWIRAKDLEGRISGWWPTDPNSGVMAIAQDSGYQIRIYSSLTRVWNGDASVAPIAWNPSQSFTDVAVEVLQFGDVVASERLRVTLNTSTGHLTWAYINNDLNIDTISSSTPANSIRFEFTYTPTGLVVTDEYVAVKSGEQGPPGPAGSLQLTIRANYQDFSTPANGWLYLHGFDDLGNPADTAGSIGYNGVPLTIGPGSIRITLDEPEGAWLILDTSLSPTGFAHAGTLKYVAAARKTRSGWVYDAGGASWSSFTATAQMIVIGTVSANSASVQTVTLWDSGIALNLIPYERSDQVQPGDLTAEAIDDLAAFASTLRPISVVSSLPSLPNVNYPEGSVVFLTSDGKLYRHVSGFWTRAVDGADLVANSISANKLQAGAVTAAALAADIVLATLFRTNSSGFRVELQGGGHVFPFWIGSGAKGSVSGSPGAGALVWYDTTLNKTTYRGALEASHLVAGSGVLPVRTDYGYDADIASLRSAPSGWTEPPGYRHDTQPTGGSIPRFGNITHLYHPGYSPGGDNSYRRLQEIDQVIVVGYTIGVRNFTSAQRRIYLQLMYDYDGANTWTSTESVWLLIETFSGTTRMSIRHNDIGIDSMTFRPKPSGWSSYLRLQLGVYMTAPSSPTSTPGTGDTEIGVSGVIFTPNLGGSLPYVYTLW